MRARTPAVALLTAVTLTGCAGAPSPPPTQRPPLEHCRTAELSARLGPATVLAPGESSVPLIYTNVSTQPCELRGVPKVTLLGPDDPNGPAFELSPHNAGATDVPLRPGEAATAPLILRSDRPGITGHGDSTGWTPDTVRTTPPGETTPLHTPWTAGGTVLREDSSTHPDEYVTPFTPLSR